MSTTAATLFTRFRQVIGDYNNRYEGHYYEWINEAARESFPTLSKTILDRTLIIGNALPNSHFEDWASSSYPDWYAVTNATAGKESTYIRGGTYSAKVTASAADGYMYITSATYPKLLDLMGQTIKIACWCNPQTANDVFMDVYYVDSTGTATTTSTTSTAVASQYNLLYRDSIAIPDDIVTLQIRFRVHTSGQYAYFDNARVIGETGDLILSTSIKEVSHVGWQVTSHATYPCDDIGMVFFAEFPPQMYSDGTYNYLVVPSDFPSERLLEIRGKGYLEDTLDGTADTISLDGQSVQQFLYMVKAVAYDRLRGLASTEDTEKLEYEKERALEQFYSFVKPEVSRKLILPSMW
jgi:hypothetical protein